MARKGLSLFLIGVLLVILLTGCGGKTKTANDSAIAPPNAVNDVKMNANGSNTQASGKTETSVANGSESKENSGSGYDISGIASTGAASQPVSNKILSQRKMIRNANISLEVDDFEVAYGKIKSLILGIGIVQESNITRDKAGYGSGQKAVTRGVIVIRVEKDKFDEVLSGVRGLGFLTNEIISTEDVTDKYFDTESRLRLLRFEESRLEQYLNKLTDPDTIFKTESRLTDIRQEIESLTGTLKKLNDLVELSTITINLSEKGAVQVANSTTYWGRLSDKFMTSLKGVFNFCGGLVIFLAQILPVLALLLVFGWLGFIIYKKFNKRNSGKDTGADQ